MFVLRSARRSVALASVLLVAFSWVASVAAPAWSADPAGPAATSTTALRYRSVGHSADGRQIGVRGAKIFIAGADFGLAGVTMADPELSPSACYADIAAAELASLLSAAAWQVDTGTLRDGDRDLRVLLVRRGAARLDPAYAGEALAPLERAQAEAEASASGLWAQCMAAD